MILKINIQEVKDMTKKNSAKRSLAVSILALVLCFTMLLGTTYAWFTDSVTSAGNIIKSGKLDATMHYSDKLLTANSTEWQDAENSAVFTYDNWEPGYTDVKYIKVTNAGSRQPQLQVEALH